MKRPVGAAALGMAAVILVWLMLAGEPPSMAQDGDILTLTGRVLRMEQKQSGSSSQLWIYLDSIVLQKQNDSVKEEHISYQLICQTDGRERPLSGSRIQVTGRFGQFTHATNPGQFCAKEYYDTQGIAGMLKDVRILQEKERFSPVREGLYRLQNYWREGLYKRLPEKEASILAAMLLGDRSTLDSDIKKLYQESGIIHILSISGLHITLLGMSLYRILRKCGCPIWAAALAGSILIFLYGMMTGMGVSAARAIGMYLIRMLGEILGRTYDMLTALGIMAVLLLAGNPRYLCHSGFLLSFGSICGIGMVLPLFADSKHRDLKEETAASKYRKALRQAVLPGLSISLFTLPVQLYYYYEVPVYSVLLNLLVLPFVSVVMVSGMMAVLLPGMSWLGVAAVWILRSYERLCLAFQGLPGHTWNPGAPGKWQIAAYYACLAVWIFLCNKLKKENGLKRCSPVKRYGRLKRCCCRLLLPAFAVWILAYRSTEDLTITFLDVGQGDCICVQTKEEVYLFDCGSSTVKKAGENILIPFLKYQGIGQVDAVFVSHPDKDHISGILELLSCGKAEGITVKRMILPAIAQDLREEELGVLLEAAQTGAVPAVYMGRGTRWDSEDVHFSCLHPKAGSRYSGENAYSQCFLLEYGSFSMLLTGDVENEGELQLTEELKRRGIDKLTVLKVAHHGSGNSTSRELLACLEPDAAVISCGRGNSYGHPHEELLDRLYETGCRIYQTQESGAIQMRVKDKECVLIEKLNNEANMYPF